jgi:hypothetical protein
MKNFCPIEAHYRAGFPEFSLMILALVVKQKSEIVAIPGNVRMSVSIQPVMLDPGEFLAYCKAKNLSARGDRERNMFARASALNLKKGRI